MLPTEPCRLVPVTRSKTDRRDTADSIRAQRARQRRDHDDDRERLWIELEQMAQRARQRRGRDDTNE
jgi:hypothetical protein